jgi:hypothetical protein
MWRYCQILDPGSLPEPYRDNVEIDRRKPDDRVVVISDQDSCPIVGHGGLEPINRGRWRPVRQPYARRREQPVVGCG